MPSSLPNLIPHSIANLNPTPNRHTTALWLYLLHTQPTPHHTNSPSPSPPHSTLPVYPPSPRQTHSPTPHPINKLTVEKCKCLLFILLPPLLCCPRTLCRCSLCVCFCDFVRVCATMNWKRMCVCVRARMNILLETMSIKISNVHMFADTLREWERLVSFLCVHIQIYC